ncbi:hypothetical protein CTI12_AA390800 [Artemisia annua]|uniref:Uncharacterized protein n=1 Tax=Artemisia annua TaxID=35608 RepID=A0A2U1ME78_ARTAN|nr:hypothetical protein CTI12_AA390800 [Artemisia annua]
MEEYADRYKSTTRGSCRETIAAIGMHKTKNKIALKANIIALVERNNRKRAISNRLGKLSKKSFANRAVRIDKNTNSEVEAENREIASDIAKIVKVICFLNRGMPVSWLLPPGTVIAAANTIVTISAAVMLHDSAVAFIHFSPSFTKFACSLVNTISGVSLSIFKSMQNLVHIKTYSLQSYKLVKETVV